MVFSWLDYYPISKTHQVQTPKQQQNELLIIYQITVQIAFTCQNNQNMSVWPNNAALINTNPQGEKEYWIDMQVKPGGLFRNCRDLLLSTSIWEAGDNDSRYIRCQQQQTDKWLKDNITEDSARSTPPANTRAAFSGNHHEMVARMFSCCLTTY